MSQQRSAVDTLHCAFLGEGELLTLGLGVLHRARPDSENETDLVDEISNVVDDVQSTDGMIQEAVRESAEEVAKGIDRPADRDNHAHVVEGLGDGRGENVRIDFTSFTVEDLLQDESPVGHTTDERGETRGPSGLTSITAREHDNGADQQTPEHAAADSLSTSRFGRGIENQIELNHLQRDGDTPVNVTVNNRGVPNFDPILTHVEIVNSGNQSDQSATIHTGLPVRVYTRVLHEKEDRGCDHRDRDNPETDTNTIMLGEETSSSGGVVHSGRLLGELGGGLLDNLHAGGRGNSGGVGDVGCGFHSVLSDEIGGHTYLL